MGAEIAARRIRGSLPLVFLILGLLAVGLVYWQSRLLVNREFASELDLRAREAEHSIKQEINSYAEVLHGMQAQFIANPRLSRREFKKISDALNVQSRFPGIQALLYTERVAPGDGPAFQEFAREELKKDTLGYPPPKIHPRMPVDEAFVVRYVEPMTQNQAGAWFDQGSELKRRAAIRRARDTGEWSATGRVRLSVIPGEFDGVIFFLPVYRSGTTPASVEERRTEFIGTVSLVVRVDEMLGKVFGQSLLNELDIEIYDMQGVDGADGAHDRHNLIFFSGSGYYHDGTLHSGNAAFPLFRTYEINIGGGLWHLQVTALPKFLNRTQSWLPPVAALATALMSLLTFFFIRRLEQSRQNLDEHARTVETVLHTTEQQLESITAAIDAVLWTVEMPTGRLKYISVAVERVSGYPADAFYSRPRLWLKCLHPDDRRKVMAVSPAIIGKGSETFEYRIVRPDGEVRWMRCEAHFMPDDMAGRGYINGIDTDITEQRRLEESLTRSNRALRAFHACEEVIVASSDENVLLRAICELAVKAGYRMAWVGVLPDRTGTRIVPVGVAGQHGGYVDDIAGLLETGDLEQFSTIGAVLRTRRPCVANRFYQEAGQRPWREVALRRGFNSKIALPLCHEEEMIGVLSVYAGEPDAFDDEAVELLSDLAQSVAVAIQALRHRSGRLAAEASSHLRERAIEASANAIIITSARAPDYPVEYVNSAFERITGYSASEVIGHSLRFLHAPEREQPGLEAIRTLVQEQREGHAIVRNYRKDGTPFWSDVHIAPVRNDAGEVSHFVAAKYDITAMKNYEEELEFQANRDALTGLANRNLLRDRLGQAIAYAARYDHLVWVVFINLDRFKLVNDTLGFEAGDALLVKIAERLKAAVRDTDTVGRLSGDEFVLVLPERTGEILAATAVQRMIDAVTAPLSIGGQEIFPSCSVGVAAFPADGGDAEILVKHAHIAMYRAKESGSNNFQFYAPEMNERAVERLRIESDLRNALDRNEFLLHYQPQVDLRSGRIIAAEALIRWRHPELGMVPPARFIGLAEETGLIQPIGAWVLRTACRQNKAWHDAGLGHPRVAVNLSVRQFAQEDLVQSIAATLEETGLEPRYLDIEVTESLVMADVERAITVLRELKMLGVQLSIDDFGTGYSSLAYLKRFPVDVLKIDKSFVQDVTNDPDDAAIVRSIISLAHSLRIHVIAEGVETDTQLAYLRRHGCDQMQGYYFSRPLPPEEFESTLREGRALLLEPRDDIAPRPTLLIVDDEEHSVLSLQQLLRHEGYRILVAQTTDEGMEILARHPVHVIVCNQGTCQSDGIEFLSKVKDLYPESIRIVLSDAAELQPIIDAINRGVIYRFFTRPWDKEVLRRNIREAFRHYEFLHGPTTVELPVSDPASLAVGEREV
ncbi:MAG TPA: EAL domain-containing protein [Noviherbaspirillum sp.]|uniref:EAL domain-containing protein n=1 Tax=Noviherbaspirillum sp. TaxID=1926288 RepID=UPI002B475659|nr:EAL domain-containing protein [Noviherbaspirillum sp.]HJV83996.1 EAL domain-containing protein [Noviherbaspirillum sp.]